MLDQRNLRTLRFAEYKVNSHRWVIDDVSSGYAGPTMAVGRLVRPAEPELEII